MTIHAYQEIYLESAQANLGDALDYAVNACHIPGNTFIELFLAGTLCQRMENGEANYLAGKSGIEIAREIVYETTNKSLTTPPRDDMCRSCEYWIGWAVAYYQWFTSRKYKDIFAALPYEELQRLYPTLHEADITKFVEIADRQINEMFPETNLKRFRTIYGCSQAELAKLSGVSLRSIQMYEQRNKDINKASAETVLRFSKALGCRMEDLIQH